jgi:phage baseplate assembly protein W
MSINTQQLTQLMTQWNARASQLISSSQILMQLEVRSPVDVSTALGPILLLDQAFAQAQVIAIDFVMADSDFPTLPIDMQSAVITELVLWQQLRSLLGAFAFGNRMPTIGTLESASPAAALYAPSLRIATIETRLEEILNVAVNSGIQISTFWAISNHSQAVVDLSMILAMDPVLSLSLTNYGFSNLSAMLTTAQRILSQMTPIAPDLPTIMNAISVNIATGYADLPVDNIIHVSVPGGATIEGLAAIYMGDESKWPQLAQFNNLVYPFISDDPIAQLGPPIGALSLVSAVSGATSITVTVPRSVYQDQRIVLQSGALSQIVTVASGAEINIAPGSSDVWTSWDTISSFDAGPLTAEVKLQITPALTATFPPSSTTVTLYNAAYDTGIVLGTGSIIRIPVTASATRSPTLAPSAQVQAQFGADIQINNSQYGGSFAFNNGDFNTVSGVNNLTQALSNRLTTRKGRLLLHPDYGTILSSLIGKGNAPLLATAAMTDAAQAALSDPRIAGTTVAASAKIQGDQVNIQLSLSSNGQEIFPPLPLSVPITNLIQNT